MNAVRVDIPHWIATLRDPNVDSIVYGAASDIDTVALVLGIDPHYLSIQVRVHIPFFDVGEQRKGIGMIRVILQRLREKLHSFETIYVAHRKLNGIENIRQGPARIEHRGADLFIVCENGDELRARFGVVPADLGIAIQRDLHYIHHERHDTLFHFGIFHSSNPAPISYAAFSRLDRAYIYTALTKSMPKLKSDASEVAVMTRAFGYSPLPKNVMSILFDLACIQLREAGFRYVVTAINPFLGFRGSSFTGASFQVFATSPMKYLYDSSGGYLSRRGIGSTIAQRYPTPPILWTVKGLSRRDRPALNGDRSVYNVSNEEYSAG
jgi:hypothetical protein